MLLRELYQTQIPKTEGSMLVYEQTLTEAVSFLVPAVWSILKWIAKRALWPLLKWILKKFLQITGIGIILKWLSDLGLELVCDTIKELIGEQAATLFAEHGIEIAAAGVLIFAAIKIKKYIEKHGETLADRWINKQSESTFEESLEEGLIEKLIWGRNGSKVVRKYRCSGGRRHGRVVSKMAQCFAPLDFKQSARFKRLKARIGSKMARKAKRTKRVNPASRRLKALNK